MFQILDYNKFNNRVMNIQIDWLKKRFDTMTQAVKKTGSVLYFKPLRCKLQDCFRAQKDVNPDQIFSNEKGMEKPPASDNLKEHEENDDAQPGTSQTTEATSTKKSKRNFSPLA